MLRGFILKHHSWGVCECSTSHLVSSHTSDVSWKVRILISSSHPLPGDFQIRSRAATRSPAGQCGPLSLRQRRNHHHGLLTQGWSDSNTSLGSVKQSFSCGLNNLFFQITHILPPGIYSKRKIFQWSKWADGMLHRVNVTVKCVLHGKRYWLKCLEKTSGFYCLQWGNKSIYFKRQKRKDVSWCIEQFQSFSANSTFFCGGLVLKEEKKSEIFILVRICYMLHSQIHSGLLLSGHLKSRWP